MAALGGPPGRPPFPGWGGNFGTWPGMGQAGHMPHARPPMAGVPGASGAWAPPPGVGVQASGPGKAPPAKAAPRWSAAAAAAAYGASLGANASEGSGPGAPDDQPKEEKKPKKPAPSNEPPNYYKVLEVNKNADEADIKKSYRKLVLQWHPDKHPSDREEAEVRIRQINNAYETLSNPNKRASYDQMLAALERKKRGVRLETSSIQPRMSIPKEFMLCPLGHPEKFVRVVGMGLRVQSRDDTPGVNFKDFFHLAKFSLWWLPEVNNMCRLRTTESASQGVDGGLNLNFMTDGAQVGMPEADVILSVNQDPQHANLIAVASPFSPGAFRFEGAMWPGHYLTFRGGSALRMAGLMDEDQDITDFVLVDYSAMFKYMTMDEVLEPAVTTQGGNDFVKLSDLRADTSVRMYFQNTLGCPVWTNKDFETYFEGHYDLWDFDAKHARVRVRPKEQQLTKRILQTDRPTEIAKCVSGAGEEMQKLTADVAAKALTLLAENSEEESIWKRDLALSRFLLVSAVPAIAIRSAEAEVPLAMVVKLHKATTAALVAGMIVAGPASLSKEETEEEMRKVVQDAVLSINEVLIERIKQNPASLEFQLLAEVLSLDLNWEAASEPLVTALQPHLSGPRPPGAFLELLRALLPAGEKARSVAEALAKREIQATQLAQGALAAEVLLTIVEGGLLLGEVVEKLQPPVVGRLPLQELLKIVAALGEKGACKPALRASLEIIASNSELHAVPAALLLRLAVVATKVTLIDEITLGPVAAAAATTLQDWNFDDMAKMLLAAAKAKASATSEGVKKLFVTAIEVLSPKLKEMSSAHLLKTVLAVGTEAGRPLLEKAAVEALDRLSDLRPAQLVLLTQGLLPLGGNHPSVAKLMDFWTELFSDDDDKVPSEASVSKRRKELENQDALSPDQMSRLVQLVVNGAPEHIIMLEAVGERICKHSAKLTAEGREMLKAAFPDGFGPVFPCKDRLIKVAQEAPKPPKKKPPAGSRSRSRGTPAPAKDPVVKSDEGHGKAREGKSGTPKENGENGLKPLRRDAEREDRPERPWRSGKGGDRDFRARDERRFDRGRDFGRPFRDRDDRGRDDRWGKGGRERDDRGRFRDDRRPDRERERDREDRDRDRDRARSRERDRDRKRGRSPSSEAKPARRDKEAKRAASSSSEDSSDEGDKKPDKKGRRKSESEDSESDSDTKRKAKSESEEEKPKKRAPKPPKSKPPKSLKLTAKAGDSDSEED